MFRSALLNNILQTLPSIRTQAQAFLSAINLKEARENNQASLWADDEKYPDLQDAKDVSDTV